MHDIGHIGKQYLSDPEEKKRHWHLGARIAGRLFGEKGFLMVAGHVTRSGYPQSRLYIPDKKSWIIAPQWWLSSNSWFENFGSAFSSADKWNALCIENAKNGFPKGSHEMYLEHKDR